jgi:hypothetical protein
LLELACEVFIRPEGYHSLILSEKAFAPSTVRYINAFHLFFEFVSLMLFVPEFLCLFTSRYACGDRPFFSYFNAAFVMILGPTLKNVFFGRFYFALIRLRVFGVVRHWKNMWINNTFVNMKWNSHPKGIFSGVFPPPRVTPVQGGRKHLDKAGDEKFREGALTNASNIGTALTVINSHRALMIL